MNVVGLDPGFGSFGWAVIDVQPGCPPDVLAIDTFTTAKAANKRSVLACEDNFDRSRRIYRFLAQLFAVWRPVVVGFEAWSPVRNAGSAAKVAFSYGVLAAAVDERDLAVQSPTPQRVKKALCGRQNATKEEVAAVVRSRVTDRGRELFRFMEGPKGKQEHGFDALAVALVILDSDLVRALGRV